MKRFLACLLVLILLCGQAALAESPVQYTCGFAMDFEELVFIVNNERIDMPSAHYRLLTTDQFDQVQLSLSMERNGQDLLALWAEELPDGNGSLTLSNCSERVFFRGDECPPRVFLAKLFKTYIPSIDPEKVPALPELLKPLFNAETTPALTPGTYNYGQLVCRFEKLEDGRIKAHLTMPSEEIECICSLDYCDAEEPLFDLSDRNTIPYEPGMNLMENAAVAPAIMEMYSNILQDDGFQKLIVLSANKFAEELPDQK